MSPQQSIGHYRIVSKLGEGGMGAVYRATDTRLNRDVALKVLTEALAKDADYLARFTREAQVLASLNHPNIAQIYGIEQGAIVMELVEGRTLEGQFPVEAVIDYARQIAEALEAAHEKGVIHRDLKPANIKVTPEGVVKVLDFGLAKAVEPTATATAANSPTLTLRSTQLGVIMGTAGYMAPEQAAGKPVDKRADIWAFGVVLYEMLTGARLFGGETVAHTLADVLRAPIDLGKLPRETPANVRTLIERCLDRNLKTRLRDIGEARIALSRPVEGPAAAPGKPNRLIPVVVAAAALIGIADFAARYLSKPAPTPGAIARFALLLPDGTTEISTGAAPMWIPSPDGRNIVFPTAGDKEHLWVREVGSAEARPLAKAALANFPFWSPDSQSVGYFSATGIERVSIADGSVRRICDTGPGVYNRSGGGGAWSPNGSVVFSTGDGGLKQCPANGGTPTTVTTVDAALAESSHLWPQFLPDGKHFLYLVRSENPESKAIYVQELGSARRVKVLANATRAMWAPPDWLLFSRDETLLAQRFDPATLRLSGEPVTVEPSVADNDSNGRSAFAVAAAVLVTRPAVERFQHLIWRDRAGNETRSIPLTGLHSNLRLSPDERFASLNLTTRRPNSDNTWTVNLASGAVARAGFDPLEDEGGAAWSPDSRQFAYTRQNGGILRQDVGSPTPVEVAAGFSASAVRDWSPDGRYLVVTERSTLKTFLVPVSGGGKPEQVLDMPVQRTQHRVSPDGKWVAFTLGGGADRKEVWLAAFPSFADRQRISVNGGQFPVWRKDSRELVFVEADGTLVAIPFSPGPGGPKRLFKLATVRRGYTYAELADGSFLVLEAGGARNRTGNIVTLNWTLGLKP
jgi:Tol biopolymer transport system component/predicted Ser/Thr protein kinase